MGCVQGVGQDSTTNYELFCGYDGKEKEEYGIGGAWEGLYPRCYHSLYRLLVVEHFEAKAN